VLHFRSLCHCRLRLQCHWSISFSLVALSVCFVVLSASVLVLVSVFVLASKLWPLLHSVTRETIVSLFTDKKRSEC
jgi:hypothetical protein